jgi:hypothetical protein
MMSLLALQQVLHSCSAHAAALRSHSVAALQHPWVAAPSEN